jgi:hypothetical protein
MKEQFRFGAGRNDDDLLNIEALIEFDEFSCSPPPEKDLWGKVALDAMDKVAPILIKHIQRNRKAGLKPRVVLSYTPRGFKWRSTTGFTDRERANFEAALGKVKLEASFSVDYHEQNAGRATQICSDDPPKTNGGDKDDVAKTVRASELPIGEQAFLRDPAYFHYMMRILSMIKPGSGYVRVVTRNGEIICNTDKFNPTDEERATIRKAWAKNKHDYPGFGRSAYVMEMDKS